MVQTVQKRQGAVSATLLDPVQVAFSTPLQGTRAVAQLFLCQAASIALRLCSVPPRKERAGGKKPAGAGGAGLRADGRARAISGVVNAVPPEASVPAGSPLAKIQALRLARPSRAPPVPPSCYERLSGGTAPRRGRPTGGRGPHPGPPQGGPQARKSGHAVALHDTGRLLATLCGATSYGRFPCRITWITPPKPPSNVLPASSMQAARLVFTRFIMLILLPRQGRFVKIVPSCERNALFKPTCGTRLRTSQLARPGRPASQYTLRTPSVHACTSPTAVTGTWVQPSCGVSPTFRHARAPLKLSLAHAAAQGIGPSAPLPARPHCGARRNARQGARGRRARILMTRPPRTPAGGAGR